MAALADGLTKLSGRFAAKIVFEAVFIPLAVFWFLAKLFGVLFNVNFPPVLKPEMIRAVYDRAAPQRAPATPQQGQSVP